MSKRIIDAGCLINLYATGTEDSIFQACDGLWVPDVLKKIELFAKFRPRRSDPLYGWWVGLTETT